MSHGRQGDNTTTRFTIGPILTLNTDKLPERILYQKASKEVFPVIPHSSYVVVTDILTVLLGDWC